MTAIVTKANISNYGSMESRECWITVLLLATRCLTQKFQVDDEIIITMKDRRMEST